MIRVTDQGSARYILVRGRARKIFSDYSILAVWSSRDRGWNLRRERLSDFLAAAQESGVHVEMTEAHL